MQHLTQTESYLAANLQELADTCYDVSVKAGWWTAKDGSPLQDNPLVFSNKLALIHSEISEALEGDRKGKQDDHLPEFKATEVELADALIRIFDLAGAYKLDIARSLVLKMRYNLTRADHQKAAREAVNGKKY